MRSPRLLLLARPGDARRAIQEALAEAHVVHEAVARVSDARDVLTRAPHNGILFEVSTLLHADPYDRACAQEWALRYPSARLRFDPRTGGLRLIPLAPFGNGDASVAEFVARDCRPFPARRWRIARRPSAVLPVLLCEGGAAGYLDAMTDASTARRTLTTDLTEGGCFLLLNDPPASNTRVALIVPDLEEPAPILGTVRWSREWGVSGALPGAGVRFDDLGALQRKRIRALVGVAPPA